MTETTKQGLSILVASLPLGALGQWLLWEQDPGLYLFLWISLTAGTLLVPSRREQTTLTGEGRWLLLPTALLAGALVREHPK